MGYYDDWREWLANRVFRLWRHMRPLVRSASSARMASMYSIGGFVLAIVAIPIALIAWPAVLLAGVGMFAGFGYAMDGYVKRFSMRVAPGHDSRIHARDFYNPPLAPDDGYRLVTPTEASQAQLYPYTDLSDHSLFIQAENDLTRDQRASLYERWYTLCPAGFMHLEVREGDHWRPIAVSIMLPLSGAGFKAITVRDKRRLSVVDLDEDGIRRTLDRAHPFLLIDTWIVDREGGFGGARPRQVRRPRRQCQPARAAAPDAVLEFLAPFRALDVAGRNRQSAADSRPADAFLQEERYLQHRRGLLSDEHRSGRCRSARRIRQDQGRAEADRVRPRARRNRAGATELVLQGLGHHLRSRPR